VSNRMTVACALALSLAAMSSGAAADDDVAEAKAHFQAGVKLLKAENYAGAAVEFEESVALYPTANVLFNLANCYKALHRYADSLATFERLEKEFGDEIKLAMKEAIARHQQEIRDIVAQLTIRVEPEGARVEVGDAHEGEGPVVGPVVLSPGEYEVKVSLDGYEETTLRIKLVAKAVEERTLTLVPAPAALSVKADQEGARVIVDGEEVGQTPLYGPIELAQGEHTVLVSKDGFEDSERDVVLGPGESFTLDLIMASVGGPDGDTLVVPSDDPRLSPLFWAGLGLTAAAGATAVVFWGLADREHGEFTRLNDKVESGELQPGDPEADELHEARDDGKVYSGLALGFGIGAGVFALATGVILAFDLTGDDDEAPPAVTLAPAPNGLKLTF